MASTLKISEIDKACRTWRQNPDAKQIILDAAKGGKNTHVGTILNFQDFDPARNREIHSGDAFVREVREMLWTKEQLKELPLGSELPRPFSPYLVGRLEQKWWAIVTYLTDMRASEFEQACEVAKAWAAVDNFENPDTGCSANDTVRWPAPRRTSTNAIGSRDVLLMNVEDQKDQRYREGRSQFRVILHSQLQANITCLEQESAKAEPWPKDRPDLRHHLVEKIKAFKAELWVFKWEDIQVEDPWTSED